MLVSELLYVLFLGLTFGLFVSVRDISALGYLLVPVPLLVPIIFILLHIFVGFLQAFVFTLLPAIYIGGAVAEEH
jgi:F-type H+-transporting ATPase subunit a